MIKNLGDQQKKWKEFNVKPFETVIAIQGVEFVEVLVDPAGQDIIACKAFQDTILEVSIPTLIFIQLLYMITLMIHS